MAVKSGTEHEVELDKTEMSMIAVTQYHLVFIQITVYLHRLHVDKRMSSKERKKSVDLRNVGLEVIMVKNNKDDVSLTELF